MNIETLKQLSYDKIRKMYKSYLETLELSKNTVQTFSGDTFYLWNNAGQKEFWDVVSKTDEELTEERIWENLDKKLEEVKVFEEKLKGYLI